MSVSYSLESEDMLAYLVKWDFAEVSKDVGIERLAWIIWVSFM